MSTPRLILLFDLLKTADDLTIHDESVSSWDVDPGSEQPAVYRLDSSHRIYRFEDQLVELDADASCRNANRLQESSIAPITQRST